MAKLVSGYSYLKVSNFVVNSISANGSNGSSGQYLTSNGTSSYWSTFSLNTAAQYTFTNTISFSNTVTIDNNKNLNFKTVNTSAVVSFVQQTDDNFVMYSTNTAYGQKAIWSVYANSITSNLQIQVPLQLNAGLVANGGLGSAGQVLTSNGTTTYWSTVSGGAGGSVNTAAQYTWTNLHTFSANVAFTGNGIGLTTNTAAIYLGGLADNNWKIGRNTGSTTKWRYTNNSIDVIVAASALEGYSIGLISGNSYFETGYLGTYIAANVTIGNSSSNSTINSTAFSGSANNTTYLNGQLASYYTNATNITTGTLPYAQIPANIVNTTGSFTLSGNTTLAGTNTVISSNLNVTGTFINVASAFLVNSTGAYHTGTMNAASYTVGTTFTANATLVNTAAINVTGQVNTATLFVTTSANIASSNIIANTAGIFVTNTTGVVNAAVHSVGTSTIANSTGVYTGIINAASHTVGAAFTANATLTNTVSLVVSTNTSTFGTAMYVIASGNVGIGVATPAYTLEVNGSFAATTKSFVIDHPSKKGMKLRHGSLEGPENGVYVRGRTNTNIIELPDYWVKLIDKDSITVSLTAIGKTVCPSVGKITNKKINLIGNDIDCFFHVFAERKDVEKLVVEY
jgi:hypothetical protein